MGRHTEADQIRAAEANKPNPAKDVCPAREALASTAPTTFEGLFALTAFIKETTDGLGEFYFDAELSEQEMFATTLAKGVSNAAPRYFAIHALKRKSPGRRINGRGS